MRPLIRFFEAGASCSVFVFDILFDEALRLACVRCICSGFFAFAVCLAPFRLSGMLVSLSADFSVSQKSQMKKNPILRNKDVTFFCSICLV